jgi:hypothetical protein
VEAPGVLADGGEHIEEGRGRLGAIPGANQPGCGESLLNPGGIPEQHEIVDDARHGGGAGDGGGGLVLGVLEAEELLVIVKRHFNGPPARVAFQDEGGVAGEVGTEEGLVTTPAARIPDNDDPDRLVPEGTVPEGGAAKDERGDRL